MTFKQLLKIINLIFVILAAICLFIPTINYAGDNYNVFKLVNLKGTKFLVVVLIVFVIASIITALMQISYDVNKIIPVISLSLALVSGILGVLIKYISGQSGSNFWLDYAKLQPGAYILFISMFIAFILNLIITIRSFILHKNDDDYLYEEQEEKIEMLYNDSSSDVSSDEYLIDEFNNK